MTLLPESVLVHLPMVRPSMPNILHSPILGRGMVRYKADAKLAGAEVLGQKLELRIRTGTDPRTPEEIVARLQSAMMSDVGKYFESIDAASLEASTLEIDFRAVGYPKHYRKRIALGGPIGAHEVEEIPA